MSSFIDFNCDPQSIAVMNIIIPVLQLKLEKRREENERLNSLVPSLALTTISLITQLPHHTSHLPPSPCAVIQIDLSFDMWTSSSQTMKPLCSSFPLHLLPVTSMTGSFLCSSRHCGWQLPAPCPRSSSPPSPRLQTDNPLIHQLLLLSPETGRAPFHAVISPPGVFSEISRRWTRAHAPGCIPLSWQTPSRFLWSHLPPIASSPWSELWRMVYFTWLLPASPSTLRLASSHFKMAVHPRGG